MRLSRLLPLVLLAAGCRDASITGADIAPQQQALAEDSFTVIVPDALARLASPFAPRLSLVGASGATAGVGANVTRNALSTFANVTFEGLGDLTRLENFPLAGARFELWMSVVDNDAPTNGSGSFALEPSPSTAITWICRDVKNCTSEDSYREIIFQRPVAQVSFQYSSTASVTMEAYGRNGDLLQKVDSVRTQGTKAYVGDPSDPTGNFWVWRAIGVSREDNVIYRVRLRGSPNRILIDDYTFLRKNYPPIAAAGSGYSAQEGQPINFSGSFSYDPIDGTRTDYPGGPAGDSIAEYRWSFGDGSDPVSTTSPTTSYTYPRSGIYTATLQVKDPNGVWSVVYEGGSWVEKPVSVPVVVSNVAPVVNAGADVVLPAGQSLNLSAAFTDPGTDADDAPWTYTIEWGDGSPNTVGTTSDRTQPIQASRAYAAPGTYTVKVQVVDADGGTGSDELVVTFQNAPPVASFPPLTQPALEGSPVSFDGSASTDPEGLALTYGWDFGDGVTLNPGLAQASHTFRDNGSFQVRLDVRDPFGSTASRTRSVTVLNVAPTASFSAPASVAEGTAFALALSNPSDPSSADRDAGLTYAFDCGGGSFAADPNGSVSCTPLDNGTLAVRGRIGDKDGGATDYSGSVSVSNVAPVVTTAPADTAIEGDAITLRGSFVDPGKADSWTYSIDWADGNVETGSITTWSPTMLLNRGHTYLAAGTYVVTLTVRDDDGGQASSTSQMVINARNRAPIANPGSYTAQEGSTVTFSAAASTDPDGDPITGYLWDFGGGQTSTQASPTRPYPDDGTFPVSLTVIDSKGAASVAVTTQVQIHNVAPSINPVTNLVVPVGTLWQQPVTFADPGADSWKAAVNYGDGSPTDTIPLTSRTLTLGKIFGTVGTRTVAVTVRDDDGGVSGTLSFTVTVFQPNQAPTALAAVTGGAIVECSVAGRGSLRLDGRGSSDPDGPAGLRYAWAVGGDTIARGDTARVTLPLGTHTVVLRVTDPQGAYDTDDVRVEVRDTRAPVLTASATPGTLWPPNHKYERIVVGASATDACTASPSTLIAGYVESNEADEANGTGDGNTTGDIRVTHVHAGNSVELSSNTHRQVTFHPGDRLEVRSERFGTAGPRIYSITLSATDASGNRGTTTTTVTVEHDQSGKQGK